MLLSTELVSLLDEVLKQPAKLRKGGTEATYYCKCGHHKRKLEVLLEPPFVFSCWVCHFSGNLYTLFKAYKASPSCYNRLSKITGNSYYIRKTKTSSNELCLPDEFRPLSISVDLPEYKNARYYLKQRGITLEDILRYNIGYGGEGNGEYSQHIIIPSYDLDGKLNFFIGRRYYTEDKGIPYKKHPNASMNIIGFELFINYNEPLILVESPFNALTIRNNAIPLFGKYPSRKLYETMLINKVKKVYVCLDTDAERDALGICEKLLELGISPFLVEMSGGKDPNEIGFKKMTQFIRNAKEVDFTFLMNKKLKM